MLLIKAQRAEPCLPAGKGREGRGGRMAARMVAQGSHALGFPAARA